MPKTVADINSSTTRSVLVVGAIVLWVMGLLWVLHRKGIVSGPRSDGNIEYGADEGDSSSRAPGDGAEGEEPVSEIVIKTGPSPAELAERARLAQAKAEAEAETGAESEGPPTYPVWFESERDIGVCKITYEGGAKTANLHVVARLPEGELSFSYQCGSHRGQGSIDVKTKRVNGVLFCKKAGGVAVKTVRRKDARCANR